MFTRRAPVFRLIEEVFAAIVALQDRLRAGPAANDDVRAEKFVMKLFKVVIYRCRLFVPCRPFQPSLTFVGEATLVGCSLTCKH
jgi:hypothetical protein